MHLEELRAWQLALLLLFSPLTSDSRRPEQTPEEALLLPL
jgi:hypothetical protein